MISYPSFYNELLKIAATRYEKEIAKGTITRDQVVPGISSSGITSGSERKRYTRDELYDPAINSFNAKLPQNTEGGRQIDTDRIRSINQKSFEANRANPRIRGVYGINVLPRHKPLHGPAAQGANIFLPDDTGKLTRSAVEAKGFKSRAQVMGATFNRPKINDFTGYSKSTDLPVDKTLNRAIGLHEMGEMHTATFPTRHPGGGPLQAAAPISGHMGMRPLLEERLATRQDPEARRIMNRARGLDPDDVLAQRALRRAGSNPFNPISGGTHEAAALKEIHRNADRLSASARSSALGIAGATRGTVHSYVPDDVLRVLKAYKAPIGDKLRGVAKVLKFVKGKK